MKKLPWFSVAVLVVSAATVPVVGCKPRPKKTTTTDTTPVASSTGAETKRPAETGIPKHMPKEIADQLVFRVLVGPQLLIQPDKGIGPVRFGATAETVERLMESKPTEVARVDGLTVLRYQSHAVEFTLQEGVVVKIYIHGNEREYVQGKGLGVENSWGIFNGAFSNGSKLGMYVDYAKQGNAKRTERVEPGRYPTVERHYYPNMVLEYDKLRNGNVVLAGVILTKPGWNQPAASTTAP